MSSHPSPLAVDLAVSRISLSALTAAKTGHTLRLKRDEKSPARHLQQFFERQLQLLDAPRPIPRASVPRDDVRRVLQLRLTKGSTATITPFRSADRQALKHTIQLLKKLSRTSLTSRLAEELVQLLRTLAARAEDHAKATDESLMSDFARAL